MNEFVDRLPATSVRLEAASETAEDLAREFEARVLDSSGLAFHVAYSVLRHPQDAEDIAQDAFIRARRAFHKLRDRDRFRGWLARMVWRMALDLRRGDRHRRSREDCVASSDGAIAPSHELQFIEDERSRRLWAAVDALPESLRLVVVLTSIQEHSVKEVSLLMELPEGTVKSRLFTARQRLQELLR